MKTHNSYCNTQGISGVGEYGLIGGEKCLCAFFLVVVKLGHMKTVTPVGQELFQLS